MKARQLRPVPTLIAVMVISLVCLFEVLGTFRRFEWITYDWRVRQAAQFEQVVAPNLGAVFVDDESIKEINETFGYKWPWPRQLHGQIVRELKAQGAKAVGFDILFSELHEPDPNADVALSENEKLTSDEFFARQLKSANNVILASSLSETVVDANAVLPANLFATNTWALGHIYSQSDSDGVLRRARPFINVGNQRIWHMGIQLAARELNIDLDKSIVSEGRIALMGREGIVREIPLDEDGTFYINWTLAWNDPRLFHLSAYGLPYLDELRQAGETNEYRAAMDGLRAEGLNVKGQAPFRGKLVIVGSIGLGNNISDFGATPLNSRSFLVSKHWNVANSVLTQQFIVKSPLLINITLIFLLGLLAAILTWEERIITASLLIILVIVAYVVFCDFLFIQTGYWLPIFTPAAGALLATHVLLVTHRAIFEQAEQRKIKGVFSKMVSPKIVTELLKMPKLALGGSRREITIYFADVRGFTEMTDGIQARAEEYVKKANLSGAAADAHFDKVASETLETVNLYLGTLTNLIIKHDGTLDKYIGDCVMAFWGAPTPNEKHALCAVRSAIGSQRAIYILNKQRGEENEQRKRENVSREAAGQPPLELLPQLTLGSGINTGVSIVGMMGSDAHGLSYTVFGREVNLASRLEGVSGRARIIIGEHTYEDLQRDDPKLAASFTVLDPVTVKGFRAPVKIYEVPWKTEEILAAEKAATANVESASGKT